MRQLLTTFFVAIMAGPMAWGGEDPTPLQLFDQRIMPIFRSPEPSSCVQCHLASVDLKKYILPSQEKTFASLRDQGLIDLDDPLKSKILTLIRMGEKDVDAGARLIHEKTRKAEYEAFAAWVKACCDDPNLRDLPAVDLAEQARPEPPDEVIRHARKSRVVDSFVRNVWSQRMRCFPCHTPNEVDPSNPKHKAAVKTRSKLVQTYGESLGDRLDLFRETPEATVKYMIEASRNSSGDSLPLINLENPSQSLLVRKPTSKLPKRLEDGTFETPSSIDPVSHMGGLKMHKDDQSYKSFIAWIQDYANVVGGRYVSVGDLPADNWYVSNRIVRLRGAPKAWPVGIPVQLFVYARNSNSDNWNAEPVAFTQGTVTPRRMVNGALILLLPVGAESRPSLTGPGDLLVPGDYVIKVYVDQHHRLADNPTMLLGEEDFVGRVELNEARWEKGFRKAETILGKNLRP